ncbi:MAG: hypothetical protein CBARDCOR_3195, partial [uncultured Caballeronia sp.]
SKRESVGWAIALGITVVSTITRFTLSDHRSHFVIVSGRIKLVSSMLTATYPQ